MVWLPSSVVKSFVWTKIRRRNVAAVMGTGVAWPPARRFIIALSLFLLGIHLFYHHHHYLLFMYRSKSTFVDALNQCSCSCPQGGSNWLQNRRVAHPTDRNCWYPKRNLNCSTMLINREKLSCCVCIDLTVKQIQDEGRLPENALCGRSFAGTPSARVPPLFYHTPKRQVVQRLTWAHHDSTQLHCPDNRLLTLAKSHEITRHDRALMNELIETVLSVGSWFTKIDLTSIERKFLTTQGNLLTVTLHIDLLNMCGKSK